MLLRQVCLLKAAPDTQSSRSTAHFLRLMELLRPHRASHPFISQNVLHFPSHQTLGFTLHHFFFFFLALSNQKPLCSPSGGHHSWHRAVPSMKEQQEIFVCNCIYKKVFRGIPFAKRMRACARRAHSRARRQRRRNNEISHSPLNKRRGVLHVRPLRLAL